MAAVGRSLSDDLEISVESNMTDWCHIDRVVKDLCVPFSVPEVGCTALWTSLKIRVRSVLVYEG